MLEALLFVCAVASWVYWLLACWWVRGFFRHATSNPHPIFTPPVSILKPVKGLDFQAYENFVTFCQQDYPEFELLFGVSDATDPAVPIIERLQHSFPQRHIGLYVAQGTGPNCKASILHHLAEQACHEVLVVSDSDMRVTPDYLRRVVAPLAREDIGLVTCPYRGEAALNLTARLEALYLGSTFLPSVMVARRFLDMRFALGATLALRRSDLARIGGFAAVADYLADDYQIGARVASLGLRVHLSDYVVAYFMGATTFRGQWDREVRWLRCSRVSRPLEYPGMIITFSTPLAATLALASGFSPLGRWALLISVLVRWLVAWLITGYTGDRTARRWLIWLPLRDMLSALVWCAGGLGRSVTWRGQKFRLLADGRMLYW